MHRINLFILPIPGLLMPRPIFERGFKAQEDTNGRFISYEINSGGIEEIYVYSRKRNCSVNIHV